MFQRQKLSKSRKNIKKRKNQEVTSSKSGELNTRSIYDDKTDCVADWGDGCDEIQPGNPGYARGRYYSPFHAPTYKGARSTRTVKVHRSGFGTSSTKHSSGS